jgi:ubiquinone/menaquinone biosynthesis C-methylase UbiE
MNFKDYFSGHASNYEQYRPSYPQSLFQFLRSITPQADQALDVATGNGQAAIGLSAYFSKVTGIDASSMQIMNARSGPNISYRVASAENTGCESSSCDIVTVAQALHWFDLEHFYAEVKRILKPGGLFAAWCYVSCTVNEEIDHYLNDYYHNIVGDYWPPERVHVEAGYADLPFPFAQIEMPEFEIRSEMTLKNLIGYLGTWSSTVRYQNAKGENPLIPLYDKISPIWGDDHNLHTVRWPILARAGRNMPDFS